MFAILSFLALCDPVIVPMPYDVIFPPGTWDLVDGTQISYPQDVEHADQIANFASAFLADVTGYKIPLTTEKIAKGISFIKSGSKLGDEEYKLEVNSSGAVIEASTMSGFLYGFTTFLQLFPPEIFSIKPQKTKWTAQFTVVHDYPRFQWRGLMIDCSRHFFDINILKRTLRLMALHKLNTFHWHLIDDQGWRLEIKKYPLLTTVGGVRDQTPKPWDRDHGDGKQYGPYFYTQEQIKDLINYAHSLGITIVPEIEMPGHSRAGLAGYPQFTCAMKEQFKPFDKWGRNIEIYCPGNDKTFDFIHDIFEEVFELFDSQYIHVGGDEVTKTRWIECSKCQARIKSEGLKDENALQSWFTKQISIYLDSKGRHLIGWDEILDGGDLVKGAAVMSWRGVEGGKKAAEMGHNVVMSPTSNLYFDYHQTLNPEKYEYLCCLNTLNKAYIFDPQNGISEEKKKFIIGVQANQWTEYVWGGEDDLMYKLFPRTCALAEVGWTQLSHKDYNRFLAGLTNAHFKRLTYLGIDYAPHSEQMSLLPKLLRDDQTVHWVLPHKVLAGNNYQVVFLTQEPEIDLINIQVDINGRKIGPKDLDGKVLRDRAFTFEFNIPYKFQEGEQIRISVDIPKGNGNNLDVFINNQ